MTPPYEVHDREMLIMYEPFFIRSVTDASHRYLGDVGRLEGNFDFAPRKMHDCE